MKQILLISFFISFSVSLLIAQPISLPKLPANTGGNAKPTATESRLIQHALDVHIGSHFATTDSGVYKYLGNHKGDPDNLTGVDSAYLYKPGASPGQFVPQTRYGQSFDANDRSTGQIRQYWNNGSWHQGFRLFYNINAAGLADMSTKVNWNTATGNWTDTVDRFIYTYNSQGDVTSETYMLWVGGQWRNATKNTSTYDTQNFLVGYLAQDWDMGTNMWVDKDRYTYTNNPNGMPLDVIQEEWNAGTGMWDNRYKFLFTYDNNDNDTLSEYFDWNSANTSWDNLYRVTKTFNAANKAMVEITEQWNMIANAYVKASRTTNTYNSYDQKTSYLTETWLGSIWAATTNDRRSRYYYETFNTGITENKMAADLQVYPVPADNNITISLPGNGNVHMTVVIYNEAGAEVARAEGQEKIIIPTSQLPTGSYCIGISTGGGYYARQIIIAH